MDKRLRELLDLLERNQAGNPYAKETPFYPFSDWRKKGIRPGDSRKNPDWGKFPKPFPLDKGPRKEWWEKRMPYFPREGDDWQELLNKAQVGSAMHGRGTPSYYPGNRRENMPISSGASLDVATDPLSYVPDNVRGPQLGGVPESDRKFVDTMHRIQNAYFTGADFGYEEGWTDQLGSTQEQIDMFMAVPEEAIKHAMDNPTDAVLQEFEEYYGFPLNVNDPDMQKYFEDSKKKRPRG